MAEWKADSTVVTADSTINVAVGGTPFPFGGVLRAQVAEAGGSVDFELVPAVVIPPPQVRARAIQWQTVVRMAQGEEYRQIQWYPVYQFGGGQIRRVFLERT